MVSSVIQGYLNLKFSILILIGAAEQTNKEFMFCEAKTQFMLKPSKNTQNMFDSVKSFLYVSYLKAKMFLVEFLRWNNRRNSNNGCLVFYGYNHVPMPSEKPSGGIIKCQDLQRIYPNTARNANLLYLVSCALSLFP